MQSTQETFGYQKASPEIRDEGVQRVFSSVAKRYDVMNDLMSGGMHRLWKARMVSQVPMQADLKVLDMAGGTGDIAFRIHERVPQASITVSDRNPEMLGEGRNRALNRGITTLTWKEEDAQALSFADNSFDIYTIAFGLRNVTQLLQALKEAHRVLKIGGKFMCLEFSPEISHATLKRIYDLYSFKIIPRVGGAVTGDAAAYQYLVESIRVFPAPEKLAEIMREAGFACVRYEKMSFGAVALHVGHKI